MKKAIIQKEFDYYEQQLDILKAEASEKIGWFSTVGQYVFWILPNSPMEYCPKCGKTIWPNEDIKIKKAK